MKLLRIYWFALLATAVIWAFTGFYLGAGALFTVAVLTLLETTFSADNAVVNSKVRVRFIGSWLFISTQCSRNLNTAEGFGANCLEVWANFK